MPNIFDPNLKAELIFESEIKREGGTLSPVTTMAFLGANDILMLDKNNGTVNRIVNGVLLEHPLIDVSVANKRERGLLGIDTFLSSKSSSNTQYVFLYYTESVKDGNDVCPVSYYCAPGNDPIGNRLYRYKINGNKLANPKLLLDLPALPGPIHNGGVVKVGPDNNVYVTIGDVLGYTQSTIHRQEVSILKMVQNRMGEQEYSELILMENRLMRKVFSEIKISSNFTMHMVYGIALE
jgi:glucose/arabinose dehydrogenase